MKLIANLLVLGGAATAVSSLQWGGTGTTISLGATLLCVVLVITLGLHRCQTATRGAVWHSRCAWLGLALGLSVLAGWAQGVQSVHHALLPSCGVAWAFFAHQLPTPRITGRPEEYFVNLLVVALLGTILASVGFSLRRYGRQRLDELNLLVGRPLQQGTWPRESSDERGLSLLKSRDVSF